jgi:hypothetical protein
VYSAAEKMIQFTISSTVTFEFNFDYELGFLKNPSVQSFVSGFRVKLENSAGTVLYEVQDSGYVAI